jgi:hypothetical protein
MRIALVIISIVAAVGCSHARLQHPSNRLVGLWQFPERRVWVQIDTDGSTFQCRLAPGGTIFAAKGRFIAPDSISWQEIWGTDRVTVNPDNIVLHGQWGDFTYVRATTPLDSACSIPDEA